MHSDLKKFPPDVLERAVLAVVREIGWNPTTGTTADLLMAEPHVVAYVLEIMRRDFFATHGDKVLTHCRLLRIQDADAAIRADKATGSTDHV